MEPPQESNAMERRVTSRGTVVGACGEGGACRKEEEGGEGGSELQVRPGWSRGSPVVSLALRAFCTGKTCCGHTSGWTVRGNHQEAEDGNKDGEGTQPLGSFLKCVFMPRQGSWGLTLRWEKLLPCSPVVWFAAMSARTSGQ